MKPSVFRTNLETALTLNNIKLECVVLDKLSQYYFLSQKWGRKINITANLGEEKYIQENILDPVLAYQALKLELHHAPVQGQNEPHLAAPHSQVPSVCSVNLSSVSQGVNLKKSLIMTQIAPDGARFGLEPLAIKPSLMDIGCGGGYVGLTWQILSEGAFELILLDSDRKKINFCKQVIRECGLRNSTAIQSRVEDFQNENFLNGFDTIVSRATWEAHEFFTRCSQFRKSTGLMVVFAGKQLLENKSNRFEELFYTIQPAGIRRRLMLLRE